MTEHVIMMLLSFLGTIHIKLILFPRSQIPKRTAAHMNTQIHTHYLPKTNMRSTCTLPSKNIKGHLKFCYHKKVCHVTNRSKQSTSL